jgi:hypothetical protein
LLWRAVARLSVVSAGLAFAFPVTLPTKSFAALDLSRNPGPGTHSLRVAEDGRSLAFSGWIGFGLTKEVRAALDQNAAIRAIRLTSKGGRVQEARLLADLIRLRGITTIVPTECQSACTIVFMGGAQRIVAPEGKLGFHRDRDVYSSAITIEDTNDTDRANLIGHGVAPWFADHAYSTPSETMWIPSLDDLSRAHVVTEVTDITVAAASPAPDIGAEVDSDFQKMPVFAAIHKVAPDTYATIRGMTIDAIQHRKSAAELSATIAPYMQSLARTYLPTASDAAVIEFAKVIALELNEIATRSPEDCYGFAYHARDGKAPNVLPYLSTEILLREQTALAGVIESKMEPAPKPATDKDITPARNYVTERLIDKFGGADVEAYVDAMSPNPDRAKVCRMTIAFYTEAFSLPPDEQAQLFRFLLTRSYDAARH